VTLPGGDGGEDGPALFGPDGHLFHATSQGVRLWTVTTTTAWQPGSLLSLPAAPNGFNTDLAFNPTGRRLLAAAGADSADVWDVTDPSKPHILTFLYRGNFDGGTVAFSPDGTTLAVTESHKNDVVLRLRRAADPKGDPVGTISDLDNGAKRVAFSPDSRVLAVVDNSDYIPARTKPPAVKVYDIQDRAHPRRIGSLPGDLYRLAFSPNGHLLTATGADFLLTWNITDPHHPGGAHTYRLTPQAEVSGVAFRPDGGLLAAGDSEGTVRLWRVDHDDLVGEPTVLRARGDADVLAFSPDGRLLALVGKTAKLDSQVELWDVADPTVPTRQAVVGTGDSGGGGQSDTSALAFSPDGRILATLDPGRSINLWEIDPAQVAPKLCNSIGDVITPEQWSRYVPNLPYQPPCDRPTG
jgi:WD40 repeat protein